MERVLLTGADGLPVFGYVEDERYGLPCADLVEVMGPGAVDAIMEKLPGWAVAGPVELGEALAARGARVLRHAHEMACDLRTAPPAEAGPPDGFRFTPCDRPAEELFDAWRAAYPPGHPDHRPLDDAAALRDVLTPVLEGKVTGEVLPCGVLAVDRDEVVAGGVLVTLYHGRPWVVEVFRHPGRTPSGLGTRMLAAVRERAAAGGWERLGLAVSEGNPARRVYERLGFAPVGSSMTVVVPG
ncbi:GNAT family N-acetyltransferase [Microbispora hainanensis]|uniref:GNAT family N-acetyltransferase n=1 Tax=Microbispora hainanensis TaxID=568844 RepID=A0A544YN02_9ACTN|nr:GNAT family N-acetyltransferase [Microbispora hainanensis]TQS18107.1 GNAT family N-acetyltransferase [Microbispora hainanensis]